VSINPNSKPTTETSYTRHKIQGKKKKKTAAGKRDLRLLRGTGGVQEM
jgi:hypothetical protein